MISHEQFKEQLQQLRRSRVLQDWESCVLLRWGPGSEYIHMQCRKYAGGSSSNRPVVYEFLVRYDTVFQEPQLCYRAKCVVDGSETVSYDAVLAVPRWFRPTLDTVDCSNGTEAWFVVGDCDTGEVVGNQHVEHYVERWIDTYLLQWFGE